MMRLVLALAFCGVAFAQEPAFDVVSIRAVPPDAPMMMRSQDFSSVLPGGQSVDPRIGLVNMIRFAYRVSNGFQLVGLPDWGDRKEFTVAAKPGADFPRLSAADNDEQVRLMLRALLADRFHLHMHTEMRSQKVFKLQVAKGGFLIKEVEAPVAPAKEGHVGAAIGNDGGRMIGNKSTLAGFADVLSLVMKQPVTDDTNLKGYYDFDIRWRGSESADPHTPELGFGSAELIGGLISALKEQFGLHLASTTGMVQYRVVDHVELPTEN